MKLYLLLRHLCAKLHCLAGKLGIWTNLKHHPYAFGFLLDKITAMCHLAPSTIPGGPSCATLRGTKEAAKRDRLSWPCTADDPRKISQNTKIQPGRVTELFWDEISVLGAKPFQAATGDPGLTSSALTSWRQDVQRDRCDRGCGDAGARPLGNQLDGSLGGHSTSHSLHLSQRMAPIICTQIPWKPGASTVI